MVQTHCARAAQVGPAANDGVVVTHGNILPFPPGVLNAVMSWDEWLITHV